MRKLLEVKELLADQKRVNSKLCARLSELENKDVDKPTTVSYAEQAAKRPKNLVPKTKKDLVEFVRTRNSAPSSKTIVIKPPAGTKDPIRYLARKLDPSKDNIKVKHIANISSERAIVRVSTNTDATKIKENPALRDCEFSQRKLKSPKIIIFGTSTQVVGELERDLYNQNESLRIQSKGDYDNFAAAFRPVRQWRDKGRKTATWIVSVSPSIRKLLVEDLTGKLHLGWMRVRVEDHLKRLGVSSASDTAI